MLISPEAAVVDRQLMKPARPVAGGDAFEAYWRSLELVKLDGNRLPLLAPSPEKLARHVKLYGDEGVDEVLRSYPVDSLPLVAHRTTAPAGRRLDENTIRAIRHFHANGAPVSALANTFNLKERRVKEVLALSA